LPIYKYICRKIRAMKYPRHTEEIEHLLLQTEVLTVRDFSSVLKEMPVGSVYAYIRELIQQGQLSCVGKGKYQPVRKPKYQPEVSPWMREVAKVLIESCEGVNHCIVQKGKNLEVQVYKGEIPQVLHALKASYPKVALAKDVQKIADTLDGFIFVAPMVSEAPLQELDGISVSSLEKELVDEIRSGAEQSKLIHSFQSKVEVYPVNYDRLRRYASRRGVQKELETILSALDTQRIHMITNIQRYLESTRVTRAWLFGSFARGEENGTSDVDLLVDYDKSGGLSLLTIVRYKLDMEQLIGREVDLVENGYLKPFAVASAEKDKYLIYER